jgi:chemotaxis protein MotB
VSRERWLISYADFMTLLFAFFATMYAISTVDETKLSRVALGLTEAFDAKAASPQLDNAVLPGSAALLDQAQEHARAIFERDMAEDLRSGRVELLQDDRGLILSIPEASAFEAGSADLSDGAIEAIGRLARSLRELDSALLIEGHTDNVPIHTPRFSSNWELSTARATAVVRWLVEDGALPPERLSVAGYGEYRPRVPNESPQARARNRRVDIVVLRDGLR